MHPLWPRVALALVVVAALFATTVAVPPDSAARPSAQSLKSKRAQAKAKAAKARARAAKAKRARVCRKNPRLKRCRAAVKPPVAPAPAPTAPAPPVQPAPPAAPAPEPPAAPALPDPTEPGGAGALGLPFSPDGIWNAPLPADAPLAPTSASLVAELVRSVDQDLARRRGPWINTTQYSTPIYRVPADQPTVRVKLDQWNPALQAAFDAVPIPPGAKAAAGTDMNMVVWQPSTDTMWEFWLMHEQGDGWHATWGGRMTNVSTNIGRYSNNWGAPATSLPQMAGTITIEELAAGRIDHALAMAVPEPRKGVFVWPANRTDGWSERPEAIPEGTRFRLDPALDVESLPLPRATRILARAAQRYGMIVRDKSANVTLYAEDPTPTGSDPYPALLDGVPPNKVLQAFPWNHLVAIDPQH